MGLLYVYLYDFIHDRAPPPQRYVGDMKVETQTFYTSARNAGQ
jgi:hypothetical protein